jgi:hypothetical protein
MQRLDGTALVVNTDSAIFVFSDDSMPFQCTADSNIEGYDYDTDNKAHTYRFETQSDRENPNSCLNGSEPAHRNGFNRHGIAFMMMIHLIFNIYLVTC